MSDVRRWTLEELVIEKLNSARGESAEYYFHANEPYIDHLEQKLKSYDILKEKSDIIQQLRQRNKTLEAAYNKLKKACEKVVDPRKIGHSEPDNYTRLGCLANIANEALKESQEILGKDNE